MSPPKLKAEAYISITGLRLKRFWHLVKFYKLAAPAVEQAKAAPGNLFTDVTTRGGVHHTLTVWETEDAMRAYLYSGAHMAAIQEFSKIATGKTFGYMSKDIPIWDDVQKMWAERAKEYTPN